MKFKCHEPRLRSNRNKVKLGEVIQWHSFFAWYPVRVSSTEMAWLEKVDRRFPHAKIEWTYSAWHEDGYVKFYRVHRNMPEYRKLGVNHV